MKGKKTSMRFAVMVLIGVVGVVFFLWVWRSTFLRAEKPKDSQMLEQMLLSGDTRIMKTVTNTFTGIKIHLKDEMRTPRSELVICRGSESVKLDIDTDVDISGLVTANKTNLAYALVCHYSEFDDGYGISPDKLISIRLPQDGHPLSSVDISTVISMDDLNRGEGIGEIKDVSEDGKRLLVERSVPHRLSSTRTTYEYRVMIFDVLKKTFEELNWNRIGGKGDDLDKTRSHP